jgi:hypothetical protein
MLNRFALLFLVVALGLGTPACKRELSQAEKQAEAAKNFRIRQKQMAAKAYNDLLKNYPDSEYAEQAKQRLAALGPIPATPAPKKK